MVTICWGAAGLAGALCCGTVVAGHSTGFMEALQSGNTGPEIEAGSGGKSQLKLLGALDPTLQYLHFR